MNKSLQIALHSVFVVLILAFLLTGFYIFFTPIDLSETEFTTGQPKFLIQTNTGFYSDTYSLFIDNHKASFKIYPPTTATINLKKSFLYTYLPPYIIAN